MTMPSLYDVEHVEVLPSSRVRPGDDLVSIAQAVTIIATERGHAVGVELNGRLVIGRPGVAYGWAVARWMDDLCDELRADLRELRAEVERLRTPPAS
jgi:hypothetical protein